MTYSSKSREMASLAYHALEEKKADNITMIDIEQVSTLADYFIIASGKNRNNTACGSLHALVPHSSKPC